MIPVTSHSNSNFITSTKFEEALVECKDIKYSIVRPTAFFKSVSGQFELLEQGWPFVMFGDGEICQCNPIAETDLAEYMINCIDDETKWNKILNLGGPDSGLTMKQQGEMIFSVFSILSTPLDFVNFIQFCKFIFDSSSCKILGKEPKFWRAPISLFDSIIGFLEFWGKFSPRMEDAAELARIGKYYAVEDMLTTNPDEKYGKITLQQHYERIAVEGQVDLRYNPLILIHCRIDHVYFCIFNRNTVHTQYLSVLQKTNIFILSV